MSCASPVLRQEDIPGNFQRISNGERVQFSWFFLENPKADEYLAKEIVAQHKGELSQIVGKTEYSSSRSYWVDPQGNGHPWIIEKNSINPNQYYVLRTAKSKQYFFIRQSDYEMFKYFTLNKMIINQDDRKYSWVFDEAQYTSVYNILKRSKLMNALLNNEGVSFQIVNGALFSIEFHPANFYRGFIPQNYTYFRRENLFIKSQSFASFYNKFKPFISPRKTFIYAKPVPMGYMSEGIFYSFGDDFIYFGD